MSDEQKPDPGNSEAADAAGAVAEQPPEVPAHPEPPEAPAETAAVEPQPEPATPHSLADVIDRQAEEVERLRAENAELRQHLAEADAEIAEHERAAIAAEAGDDPAATHIDRINGPQDLTLPAAAQGAPPPPEEGEPVDEPRPYRLLQPGVHNDMRLPAGSVVWLRRHEVGDHHRPIEEEGKPE